MDNEQPLRIIAEASSGPNRNGDVFSADVLRQSHAAFEHRGKSYCEHVNKDPFVALPPHRVRAVYRSQWLDGPFAFAAGLLTLVIGLTLGNTAMGLFALGFVAFTAGLLSAEICNWFDILIQRQPVFTFANRLYAALRRYSRTRTAVIHSRYRVGQRVEIRGTGCASTISEIAAYRGKIYYRLFGFDADFREGELQA